MDDSRNLNKREALLIRIDEGELKKNVSEIVRESIPACFMVRQNKVFPEVPS